MAGAERILMGHLPYADFWSMYPPGQYYTLAFLFKLFGTSVLTERIYDLTIRSILSTLIYVVIKKLGLPEAIAIIGWGMELIVLGRFGFAGYPIFTAIVLALLGTYFFLRHMEENKPHYLMYCGIFIMASSLFRHDLAGYAAISLVLTLLLKKVVDRETGFKPLYYFASGLLLIGLPFLIILTSNIDFHLVVDQLLVTPSNIMRKYRWLPYPGEFFFYACPFVLFLSFLASWFLIIRLKIRNGRSYGMFLYSLLGLFFTNQAMVRSDSIHLLPTVILSIVAGLCLVSVILDSSRKVLNPRLYRIGACMLLLMITIPMIIPVMDRIKSLNSDYFSLANTFHKAGCARISENLRELILYIKNNTDTNDAIYVGVENHDRFIINDVAVYFLADRQYATKYHELHPGVTNTPEIQGEIIRELTNSAVRLIILVPRYWYEPNDTRIDSKIEHLDNYIREHYKMTHRFGLYEVWTPR